MKTRLKKIWIVFTSLFIILSLIFAFLAFPFVFKVDVSRKTAEFFCKPNYSDESLGWNLMLVNSKNYIPPDFDINLEEVSDGIFVDSRIYSKLTEMINAAQKDSVYMIVVSGYRSREKQQEIMNSKILEYMRDGQNYFKAKNNAEKWVAIEGTSEHQLGLAVDINQNPSLCSADKVYDWLLDNAHNYGFVKRYPSGKTYITGIINEPWHYRYVGINEAKEMKEKNLCLEEYVETLKKDLE